VVGVLSFVLAFPLFILVYYRLPNLEWPYHTDKILIFFLIVILLLLLVRSFKFIIITAVVATIAGCGMERLQAGTVLMNFTRMEGRCSMD